MNYTQQTFTYRTHKTSAFYMYMVTQNTISTYLLMRIISSLVEVAIPAVTVCIINRCVCVCGIMNKLYARKKVHTN